MIIEIVEVILGSASATAVLAGTIQMIRGGAPVEVKSNEYEVSRCSYCPAVAVGYDTARHRYVCAKHAAEAEKRDQAATKSKRRDSHEDETVRDPRQVRRPGARKFRETAYDLDELEEFEEDEEFVDEEDFEEELCQHRRDPGRCKACQQIELRRQQTSRQPVRQVAQQRSNRGGQQRVQQRGGRR